MRCTLVSSFNQLPANEDLRCNVRRFYETHSGVRAVAIFEALDCVRLRVPAKFDKFPLLTLAPDAFLRWIMRSAGSTECEGKTGRGETLQEVVNRMSSAFRCRGGLTRWEAHSQQELVSGSITLAFVALSLGARTVHNAPEQSVFLSLFSHKSHSAFKPSKKDLEGLRASIPDNHDFMAGVRGCGSEVPGSDSRLPLASIPSLTLAPRHRQVLRGWQKIRFDIWFQVDCVLLSGRLRKVSDLENATRDSLITLLGDDGARVWDTCAKNNFKFPSRQLVESNRCRLDFACMLFNRYRPNPTLPQGATTREVMLDSSRAFGREVMAIREIVMTFRSVDEAPQVKQRRLPTVAMAHRHMSAADKGMVLLHSVFLEHGPTKRGMEAWCRSVRMIPTDLGVESSVANAKNILPAFFRSLPQEGDDEFLFASGIRFPGWSHMMHNIIKDSILSSLAWFPAWKGVLSRVCDFLSTSSYVDVLVRTLEMRGHGQDIDKLKKGAPRRFVDSRWGSLFDSVSDLLPLRDVLARAWDPQVFQLESAIMQEMSVVFQIQGCVAVEFWERVRFLVMLIEPVEKLRRWGTGCECHQTERQLRQAIECSLAGRRLRWAYQEVQSTQSRIEELLGNLQVEFCEGLANDGFALLSSHRARIALKTDFLRHLPYTLARLRDPAVARDSLRDFDMSLSLGHEPHRVSARFLQRGGGLRSLVEDVAEGRGVAPKLAFELLPIEWGLMTEDVVEGEHRDLALEHQRSHATRHPFAVSTTRLNQNRELITLARGQDNTRRLFEQCWSSWKLVAEDPRVGPMPRHRLRVPRPIRRLSLRDVWERAFRLGQKGFEDWSGLARMFRAALGVIP